MTGPLSTSPIFKSSGAASNTEADSSRSPLGTQARAERMVCEPMHKGDVGNARAHRHRRAFRRRIDPDGIALRGRGRMKAVQDHQRSAGLRTVRGRRAKRRGDLRTGRQHRTQQVWLRGVYDHAQFRLGRQLQNGAIVGGESVARKKLRLQESGGAGAKREGRLPVGARRQDQALRAHGRLAPGRPPTGPKLSARVAVRGAAP